MHAYTISFGHGGSDAAGTMRREFAGDKAAVDYTRAFVRNGFRDETTASVALLDGRTYHCSNRHGDTDAYYDGQMIGDEPPRPGRPKGPPEQRRVSLTVRILPALKAKYLRQGDGARAWLEAAIEAAPERTAGEPT